MMTLLSRFIFLFVVYVRVVGAESYELSCSVDLIRSARVEFVASSKDVGLSQSMPKIKRFVDRCFPSSVRRGSAEYVAEYSWLISDYVDGLKRGGEIKACLIAADEYTYGRNGLFLDLDSNEINAIFHSRDLCSRQWEEKFKNFQRKSCGIPGYGEEGAVSLPEGWRGTSGVGESCIAVHEGSTAERHADDEAGRIQAMDRPYLILIEVDEKGRVFERFLAFSGGVLGQNSNTAPTEISVAFERGKKLVRLKGGSSLLWPGSALMSIDSVYSITPDFFAEIVDQMVTTYR